MDTEAWHAAVRGGHKELDTTKWLNWIDIKCIFFSSEWVIYPCTKSWITSLIGHLEYTGSLNYTDEQNVDTFYYTISRHHIC